MNEDKPIVIDASVIAKWFVDEKGSSETLKIRRRYVAGEFKIVVPSLMIFEVLNALYYKKLFTTEELKNASRA